MHRSRPRASAGQVWRSAR